MLWFLSLLGPASMARDNSKILLLNLQKELPFGEENAVRVVGPQRVSIHHAHKNLKPAPDSLLYWIKLDNLKKMIFSGRIRTKITSGLLLIHKNRHEWVRNAISGLTRFCNAFDWILPNNRWNITDIESLCYITVYNVVNKSQKQSRCYCIFIVGRFCRTFPVFSVFKDGQAVFDWHDRVVWANWNPLNRRFFTTLPQ